MLKLNQPFTGKGAEALGGRCSSEGDPVRDLAHDEVGGRLSFIPAGLAPLESKSENRLFEVMARAMFSNVRLRPATANVFRGFGRGFAVRVELINSTEAKT
jgi:hypothetical protein